MSSRLRISVWSYLKYDEIPYAHFLNLTWPSERPISNFVQISSRKWETYYILICILKKKESIDIQIKYFFPVYINALLNKLFIDNKRHHACIIPFLFLPQLCKLPFDSNIVDIFLRTTFTFRCSNKKQCKSENDYGNMHQRFNICGKKYSYIVIH